MQKNKNTFKNKMLERLRAACATVNLRVKQNNTKIIKYVGLNLQHKQIIVVLIKLRACKKYYQFQKLFNDAATCNLQHKPWWCSLMCAVKNILRRSYVRAWVRSCVMLLPTSVLGCKKNNEMINR